MELVIEPEPSVVAKTGHSRGVSETGTVIHVVCAHHCPGKLLKDVILLITAASRSKESELVTFISLKLLSYEIQGLFPTHLLKPSVLPYKGLLQPIRMVHEIQPIPSLNAQIAPVDLILEIALYANNPTSPSPPIPLHTRHHNRGKWSLFPSEEARNP